jgi:glycerophosphoryl diester phosphodiesterase
MPHTFWVVGHRGSPCFEVENTMPSFERAIREGANALELDLCVTRDREVVVWHDFSPHEKNARFRRWGWEPDVAFRPRVPDDSQLRKPTSELTLAEFRTHYGYAKKKGGARVDAEIPLLSRFFEWAARERKLGLVYFDIKVPYDRADLLRVITGQLDQLTERCSPSFRSVLECSDPKVARELKDLTPRLEHSLDVEPPAGIVFRTELCSSVRAAIEHGLRHATPQKPRSVTLRPFATHCRIVAEDLELMKRHNASASTTKLEGVCSFTINRESEMRRLIGLGITGMQSDRPEVLRRVAVAAGKRVEVA